VSDITVIVEQDVIAVTLRDDRVTVVETGQQGPPGPPGASGVGAGTTFDFPAAATSWTINHNFGLRPAVELIDSGGREIEAEVVHTSLNQTVVYFVSPTSGQARLS
jgi:hypothetical protein